MLLFVGVGSLLIGEQVLGQEVTIKGTVFNMYRTKPLEAVSVMSTSGKGTATDSNGNYYIVVQLQDSLYFSYLGRATAKYAVRDLNPNTGFDIALRSCAGAHLCPRSAPLAMKGDERLFRLA